MRAHWINHNDDKPPRYYLNRCLVWGGDGGGDRGWRLTLVVPRGFESSAATAQIAAFGRWQIHLALFGAGLFLSRNHDYTEGRCYGLSFHNGSLWWQWGADPMGWSSKTPKWRDGHAPISRWLLGERGSKVEEVLEERDVLVPMPEGCYHAKARLEVRVRRGRFRTRRWRCVAIDVLDKHGIPHDGKGENSWDCGADGTFGTYTHDTNSIEDGIGKLIASCLRDRGRYGNGFADRAGLGGVNMAPGAILREVAPDVPEAGAAGPAKESA